MMRKLLSLEVFIFLGIVAILSAIAIPNLMTARGRSKQKRTMADMRTVGTAWEARATDINSYTVEPDSHSATGTDVNDFEKLHRVSPAELRRALEPTYARKLPLKDGWGNDFDFRTGGYKGKDAQIYALRALGSDGRDDGFPYTGIPVKNFRDDLVFANGAFTQFPEGT